MSNDKWYIRPALEEFTEADWYIAQRAYSPAEYARMRETAKKSGLLGDDARPFTVTLESGETDSFQRAQNRQAVQLFNKELEQWSDNVISALRGSISQKVAVDRYLSNSLNAFFNQKRGEITQISFTFLREGAYIHHGAGRGYGGFGSRTRWYDKNGNEHHVSEGSAGKMGTGRRHPIDWYNPVVSAHIEELAAIVADYDSKIVINTSNILIS